MMSKYALARQTPQEVVLVSSESLASCATSFSPVTAEPFVPVHLPQDLAPYLRIPTLPKVTRRVLALPRQGSDLPQLMAAVIAESPDLTRDLLQAAVSTQPSGTTTLLGGQDELAARIESMDPAVARCLVLAVSVRRLLQDTSPVERLVWNHSFDVACLARCFAQHFSPDLAEEAFVSGLLHDLGIVLLSRHYPDFPYLQLLGVRSDNLSTLEHDSMKISHPDVASMLVNEWSMPPSVLAAVTLHDDLEFAFGMSPQWSALSANLYIADWVDQLSSHEAHTAAPPSEVLAAARHLGASERDFLEVMREVRRLCLGEL